MCCHKFVSFLLSSFHFSCHVPPLFLYNLQAHCEGLGYRYPSDVPSNVFTLSRAPSSAGSIASTAHHGGYLHSQHPSSHNSIPSRMPDAVSVRLLARIASDACANAAATSSSEPPLQDPLYLRSPASNDSDSVRMHVAQSAAVAEGCTSSVVRDEEGIHRGDVSAQDAMHVEQVESPGWRCRSRSRRVSYRILLSYS